MLGAGTVFFDVAHMSLLPAIVPKERLERGNGVLEITKNVSLLAGPGVGGWAVAALTAPIALLAHAVSYLVSALLLTGVRAREAARRSERSLRHEVAEGLRFVAGEPVLRRIAVGGALAMTANSVCLVGLPLYLVKEFGVGAAQYGLLQSAAAVGSLAGAALVARVTTCLGTGRTLYGSAALATVLYLPALATGPGWRLLIFPVAASLFGVVSAIFGIAQLSYRQRITPGHLLGRANASMRFLSHLAVVTAPAVMRTAAAP
ncbi:MFS transporter [Nonomuraea diastatica]|uniref:MFS transporter n=1 Tax=Nonomuraea diastatica TaxID=1848329 RepID=A0A4R4X7K7_9ACTN|nr:MFS transporter [Nonomuraea diastatica]TDD26431.1 MFS transporter [Nonomuraea diastatica]